jgi:acetyltransferase-like isoleucine patch superfamily enzyme
MNRLVRVIRSFAGPSTWLHPLRMLHFYGYSHVLPRRLMTMGPGTRMAPNTSIRNGERISIGARGHIGERCYLWAGDGHGRIDIGDNVLLAPEVFITASNYRRCSGIPMEVQPKDERDVRIGSDVWLGARVVVVAGVTIGDGCVVGAGAVVTRSLPAGSIAAGVPARVVGRRWDEAGSADGSDSEPARDSEPAEGDRADTTAPIHSERQRSA